MCTTLAPYLLASNITIHTPYIHLLQLSVGSSTEWITPGLGSKYKDKGEKGNSKECMGQM